MTLLIDAAPLVALADPDEPSRAAIRDALESEPGRLIIPSPTTAEIDYLLGQRFGDVARRAFLRDLAAGRFTVGALDREDYATIVDLEARYADLGLGLADCALIALAGRHRTTRILTFDERHFRAVKPLEGKAFVLLPADG
ncbi:MAG TPA: PIN domain-containing protein [Solirubrobacteraceae bacterium]|nr:PIN domain-containing protein [Solirubrobacteraceae bacterium]